MFKPGFRMIVVAVLFTVLFYFLFVSAAPVWAVERIIRVTGDRQYPPYEFLDAQGNYRGFNVDVMRAIALDKGFTIDYRPMSWAEAQRALLEGKVDVIQGMTFSPRRAEIYDFCDPIVINSQAIFVPRTTNTITSIEDLNYHTVAVQAGDISNELMKSAPQARIKYYATQDEAVQALIAGEVDAFVGNELTGWYLLEKWRRLNDFKQVGESLRSTDYCPVVRPGDEETMKLINSGLADIKRNGTYDKIYRKWFGRTRIDNTRYYKGAAVVFGLLALSILGIAAVNRRLKLEVDRRTKELRAYANTQEAILQNAPSGIISISRKGIVESSNPAATRMLKADCTGMSVSEIPLLSYLDEEEIKRILEVPYQVPRTVQHQGVWYQITSVPVLKDESSSGTQSILINISDVTAQKRLAEQEYEQAKAKALSTLVAGLAHEIRNPLTAMKTFIDLIPQKIENPAFKERIVHVLPREMSRIEQLIKELIEYARPYQARPEMCDVAETLLPVVELISAECEKKEVEFRVKLKGQVYCDPGQLQQIILNLLLNSLKAVAKGGWIALVSVPLDDEVRFTVADNGCGIPEEYQEQVFDPFFSLQGGTGLGLPLVYQMVGENGGRIGFWSKENRGTRFHIWLPIREGGTYYAAAGSDSR